MKKNLETLLGLIIAIALALFFWLPWLTEGR